MHMHLLQLKYFVLLAILLHCTGISQLANACTKNSDAVISMLNMTEEENKKEKETKEEDTDDSKEIRLRHLQVYGNSIILQTSLSYAHTHRLAQHQYSADQPTPPPDFAA